MAALFPERRLATALLLIPAAVCQAGDPTVSNVRAEQESGGKLVRIDYDLTGTTSPVFVSLRVSSDGGTSFTVPASSLSGAVGGGVSLGRNKRIIWNAGADWNNQLSNTVKFRVTASKTADGFELIPAGTFQMGDQSNPATGGSNEQPVHSVYVSAFYMDRYEVTKELWDAVRAWGLENGYTDLPVGNGSYASKGTFHPVHSINWYSMVKWCNARSEMEGLTPCYTVSGAPFRTGGSTPDCNWSADGYRLPTEAEWEKAARGGVTGKNFPWGTDTITHSQANYNSSTSYSYDVSPTRGYHPSYSVGGYPYSSPVGSFAPNGYGLHDMAGNMWEWCWDWYESGYYSNSPASNPKGPVSGIHREIRGGTWVDAPIFLRVSSRMFANMPSYSETNLGFRLARSSVP